MSQLPANQQSLAEAVEAQKNEPYVLRLFVAGHTPRSVRALSNLKRILNRHVRGEIDLQIIDVFEHREQARDSNVVAIPMLIKERPLPARRILGDMSNEAKTLAALGAI